MCAEECSSTKERGEGKKRGGEEGGKVGGRERMYVTGSRAGGMGLLVNFDHSIISHCSWICEFLDLPLLYGLALASLFFTLS